MKRQCELLMRWLCTLGALIVLSILGRSALAADEFQDLVNQVPRSANAVVLLNMEKAKQSPLGVKENWQEKIEQAFDDGLIRVPPQAKRFVLASEIDFEFMEPLWSAAVIDMDEDLSMEQIADMRGGTLDTIENLPALARPNDTYVVRLAPKTLGAMGPANRQLVTRWIRDIHKETPPPLSPYLQRAAHFSDKAGSEIIMAIDLDGVISPQRITKYLKSKQDELAEWGTSVTALAKLLSNIKGVRVGVRIGEEPFGMMVVNLDGDASQMASFAKPLLLQILSDKGALIKDFESWTAKADGNELSLSGKLSKSGLRRLLSVIDSPAPPATKAQPAKPAAGNPNEVSPGDQPAIEAQTALKHFHAVTAMANDLKADMRDAKNLASTSLFFEKYARRISRLPTLNLDKELVNWSNFVSKQLRQASMAVKTMGIQGGVRQAQVTGGDVSYDAGGRWGSYGGFGPGGVGYDTSAEAKAKGTERRVIRAEEKGIAATDCQQIRQTIIDATNDIRQKMTDKYQVQF